MATKPFGIHNTHTASNYISKKGINELFEALMTALMVHKPDDHIAFIRECLDKVPNNSSRIRWDLFLNTSNGNSSSRSSYSRNRPKLLPPVKSSVPSVHKQNQFSERSIGNKSTPLQSINATRKPVQNLPIVFVLSSANSTNLCSKLLQRYDQIAYFTINDIANIDDDPHLDLRQHEYRYNAINKAIEKNRSTSLGFLINGTVDERDFCRKWQEKIGRVDLFIVVSNNRHIVTHKNVNIIEIDLTNNFDTIFTETTHLLDEIFPKKVFSDETHVLNEKKADQLRIPIIFCVDNHNLSVNNSENEKQTPENISLDDEFDTVNEEENNSFINTLCERLAQQFSFKHIHYGEFNTALLNFDQLKLLIIESMSTYNGFIIDHFPTSNSDLEKFQDEIGLCTLLIYIGEYQEENQDSVLNSIIKKFQDDHKAIYVDCRMEVDEIYDDLKSDILKYVQQ